MTRIWYDKFNYLTIILRLKIPYTDNTNFYEEISQKKLGVILQIKEWTTKWLEYPPHK